LNSAHQALNMEIEWYRHQGGKLMIQPTHRLFGSFVTFALLVCAVSSSGADVGRYAGDVVTVDRNAGKLVVGDMGPLLANGTSEVTRRSVRITPATEFVKVTRAAGTAPSGFVGDYVETRLPAWEVKPGDFVAVQVRPEKGEQQAVRVTVVETSER
jgi:hypothetical protein